MVIIQLSLLCDSAMFFSYCQLSFYVNFNDEKGIEKTQIPTSELGFKVG